MKKTLSLFILLFLISFTSTISSASIIYPWRSTTAIVKSAETFEVWFKADNGQSINSVELQGKYNNVSTTKSVLAGNWIYDKYSNNTFDTKITVTVPAGTPADRYDLVLKTTTGDVISTGAVKVIKTYKSDYYVVHMSDAHRAQGGYDENLILQKISTVLDIANIIDPEILFETGDNQYNVRNHPEREESYFHGIPSLGIKGMNDAFAATFMTPGNHDTPGNGVGTDTDPLTNSLFYNQYYGLQSYNFTYGDGRYMVMNNAWLGFNPTQQITDAAAWLTTVGTGNLRIGAFHGPSGARVDDLTARANMTAGIAGHVHHSSDNPWVNNVYAADDMREAFAFNLYKINAVTGTWTPVGGPTAAVQALQNPSDLLTPALYKPNLTLTYLNANNGTLPANTATIVNKFGFPISNARVRFVMPKGVSYTVSIGNTEQEFDGTNFHIVDISVNLEANSTTTVLINVSNPTASVTGVTISPATANIKVGSSQQLTAIVAPVDAFNRTVSWETSNAAVATVNTSGLVKAIAPGTVTITATTQDGNKTNTSVISVSPVIIDTFSYFDDCDALTKWSSTSKLNAVDQKQGAGCLEFVGNTSEEFKKVLTTPYNSGATSTDCKLVFWYYISDVTKFVKVCIEIGSSGVADVNEYQWAILATGLTNGWNLMNLSPSTASVTGTPNLNAINWFRIYDNTKTASITTRIDAIQLGLASVISGTNDLVFNNNNEKSVNIYPNPLKNGNLSIVMTGYENSNHVEVKIINLMGQTVYQKNLNNQLYLNINTNGMLRESVYFVSVESGQSKVTRKLVVQK